MNRADALDYLQNEFLELSIEASLDGSVQLLAYKTAIDQALRGLDVPENQLGNPVIADSDVPGFLALLDYYALTRFARAFSIRTNVAVGGGVSLSQSQSFQQVQMLLIRAEKRLDGLGLSPTEQMTMGRFTLDFLEPTPGEV